MQQVKARLMRAFPIFLTLLSILVTAASVAKADDSKWEWSCAKVVRVPTDDVLWIRACPSANCEKTGLLRPDQVDVGVMSCANGWCEIFDPHWPTAKRLYQFFNDTPYRVCPATAGFASQAYLQLAPNARAAVEGTCVPPLPVGDECVRE